MEKPIWQEMQEAINSSAMECWEDVFVPPEGPIGPGHWVKVPRKPTNTEMVPIKDVYPGKASDEPAAKTEYRPCKTNGTNRCTCKSGMDCRFNGHDEVDDIETEAAPMDDKPPVNIRRVTFAANKKQFEFEQYCRTGIHPSGTDTGFRTTTERVGNKPPISLSERELHKLIEVCTDQEELDRLSNRLHVMYLERHNTFNPYVKPAIGLKGNRKITDAFAKVNTKKRIAKFQLANSKRNNSGRILANV